MVDVDPNAAADPLNGQRALPDVVFDSVIRFARKARDVLDPEMHSMFVRHTNGSSRISHQRPEHPPTIAVPLKPSVDGRTTLGKGKGNVEPVRFQFAP